MPPPPPKDDGSKPKATRRASATPRARTAAEAAPAQTAQTGAVDSGSALPHVRGRTQAGLRSALLEPRWWAGAAAFLFNLTAVAAALVALQLFQADPRLSVRVTPEGTNAAPGGGNPHMVMLITGIDVQLQAGSGADVRDIVVIPISGYVASPLGSDQIALLPAGQQRTVHFEPASGADAMTADDHFQLPFAQATFDRTPSFDRNLVGVVVVIVVFIFAVGLVVSVVSGRPLSTS